MTLDKRISHAMNPQDISTARDPDLRAPLAALRRASQLARKTAIQTDTELVVVRNGQMVRVSAEALRQQAESEKEPAQ